MKKVTIILLMIVAFILVYLVQVNFFDWFTISGVHPNLFILLSLFVGLYAGIKVGFYYGVGIGILLDIILGKNIGVATILYGIIGILGVYFDKTFSKDNRFMLMLMVTIATLVCEIGTYILNIFLQQANIEIIPFLRIVSLETLYNTILTIILYPILQKAGYRIEEVFKGQKILTRYF